MSTTSSLLPSSLPTVHPILLSLLAFFHILGGLWLVLILVVNLFPNSKMQTWLRTISPRRRRGAAEAQKGVESKGEEEEERAYDRRSTEGKKSTRKRKLDLEAYIGRSNAQELPPVSDTTHKQPRRMLSNPFLSAASVQVVTPRHGHGDDNPFASPASMRRRRHIFSGSATTTAPIELQLLPTIATATSTSIQSATHPTSASASVSTPWPQPTSIVVPSPRNRFLPSPAIPPRSSGEYVRQYRAFFGEEGGAARVVITGRKEEEGSDGRVGLQDEGVGGEGDGDALRCEGEDGRQAKKAWKGERKGWIEEFDLAIQELIKGFARWVDG